MRNELPANQSPAHEIQAGKGAMARIQGAPKLDPNIPLAYSYHLYFWSTEAKRVGSSDIVNLSDDAAVRTASLSHFPSPNQVKP